tara:strand:- start:446 stop:925 length:480 start_codon:yes stop_codon:yes gene_type:complete
MKRFQYVVYVLLAVLMLVNLIVTGIIQYEYALLKSGGEATGCFVSGSCGTVANSQYSSLFGIPLPILGFIGFGVALILLLLLLLPSLQQWSKHLLILNAISMTIGGVGAAYFIYLQYYVIGAFCTYCTIVDTIMIVAAILFWIVSYKNIYGISTTKASK